MPTVLQNQLYQNLFRQPTDKRPMVFSPTDQGTMQFSTGGMESAPPPPIPGAIPPSPAQPFFGVQENPPAQYASVPGFDQIFQPAISPRNPGLDIAALLGIKNSQFDNANPFQQAAVRNLFTTQEQLLGTLQNFGQGAKRSVDEAYQTRQNNLMSQLAERGLLSSSILPSVSTGIERSRTQSMLDLADQLLGKKFDVISGSGAGISNLLANIGAQIPTAEQKQAQKLAIAEMQKPGGNTSFGGNPTTMLSGGGGVSVSKKIATQQNVANQQQAKIQALLSLGGR